MLYDEQHGKSKHVNLNHLQSLQMFFHNIISLHDKEDFFSFLITLLCTCTKIQNVLNAELKLGLNTIHIFNF